MTTITVKKSNIAMLKGLNKSIEEIAQHFGITTKEAQDALVSFGLAKQKGRKVVDKGYSIKLVDDTMATCMGEAKENFTIEEYRNNGKLVVENL